MTRFAPIALLAALALLLAGCGGSDSTNAAAVAGEVAEIVPADVQLVFVVETDPESEQWRRADELLDRFPGKGRLFEALEEELSQEGLSFGDDVLPALGDETYVVLRDVSEDEVVVITKPRDPAKLAELLRESDEPSATREVDGWTLVAENEAILDAFGEDGDRLAHADWFADAQDRVEDDALVTMLVNGAAAQKASEASVPERCRSAQEGELDAEAVLGTSLEDVLDLFAGGLAAWVRPAALIPEISVLLEPEDDARAVELLDTLVERAGGFLGVEASPRRVGDVEARELRVGPVTILYGAGDGRLVVTTASSGFESLSGDGGSLEDDEAFRDARDAAGIGDDAEVYAYVDLDRVVELLTAVAAFSEESVPDEVRANLEPLDTVVAWGDLGDPNEPEAGVFLAIR